MSADVDVRSLGSLHLIGEGGEAEVFSCSGGGGLVFKRFKQAVLGEFSERGLVETVGLWSAIDPADRDFLAVRAMWPRTVVRAGGTAIGYLMPELPLDVHCHHGRREAMKPGLSDWNKLTMRHTWIDHPVIGSTLPAIRESREDHVVLLGLMLDLARIFQVLHKYGIVAGDVSGRNLLWGTGGSGPVAYIIDCDGFRMEGRRAVTEPKQSPDWVDPHLGGDTNIDSDLYKLGLAMYRAYYSAGLGLPPMDSRQAFVAREEVAELASESASPGPRPSASQWVALLETMISGRRTVPFVRTPPSLLSPPPPPDPRPWRPFRRKGP